MNAIQALDVLKERITLFHQLNLIETVSGLKPWLEELANSGEDNTNTKNAQDILSALNGLHNGQINLKIQTNGGAEQTLQVPPMSLEKYSKIIEDRISFYQSN